MKLFKQTIPVILMFIINFSFAQEYNDQVYVENIDDSGSSYNFKVLHYHDLIDALVERDSLNISMEDNIMTKEDTIYLVLLGNEFDIIPEIDLEVNEVFDSLYYPGQLYQRGYQEGRLFYKNTGTFWGAFGVGVITPFTYFVPGLAAGVLMAVVPPIERNLRYHDRRMMNDFSGTFIHESHDLFNDINYSRGYQKGAHNKKVGNVAAGMGAGIGTGLAVIVIVVISFLGVFY